MKAVNVKWNTAQKKAALCKNTKWKEGKITEGNYLHKKPPTMNVSPMCLEWYTHSQNLIDLFLICLFCWIWKLCMVWIQKLSHLIIHAQILWETIQNSDNDHWINYFKQENSPCHMHQKQATCLPELFLIEC